jgi:hypothetical protein
MSNQRLAITVAMLAALGGCLPQQQPAGVQVVSGGVEPPNPPGASALPASVESASPSNAESALVNAYRAAHTSQDVDAMLKLYWFGSADEEMRLTIRENVEGELRSPLKDIKIEPVAPGKYGPTVEGGIHWRPSLEVVALLTANFDTSRAPPSELATQQMKITVGRRGGRCYFTVPLRD